MSVELVLADIITNELAIDPTRVVIYAQNYDAPKDSGIYVILSIRGDRVVGSTNKYDPITDNEVKTVSVFTDIDIDITSKDRTAIDRKHEIIMALSSTFARQQMELNNISIFRTGQMLDLSFIEGARALKRFRLPVVISNVIKKTTAIAVYDKFNRNYDAILEEPR